MPDGGYQKTAEQLPFRKYKRYTPQHICLLNAADCNLRQQLLDSFSGTEIDGESRGTA